jgi:hypothetical protein
MGRSLFQLISSIAGAAVVAYFLGVRHEYGTFTQETLFGPVDTPSHLTQINLLPLVLGGLLGGVGGYLLSILVLYAVGRPVSGLGTGRRTGAQEEGAYRTGKAKERRERKTGKNIVLFAGFLGVSLLAWLFLFAVTLLEIGEHVRNEQQGELMLKVFAVISLLIGWIIVGRKIVLTSAWGDRLDRLLRGPFSQARVPWLNKRQQKVLWVGIVVELLLLLFPPWVAYDSLADGLPDGAPEFIGFHCFAASEYGVLGEAAYAAARISYELLGLLSLGVGAVCAILLLICYYYKPSKGPR